MALTVTTKLMRSTESAHTARRTDGGWEVTWLPDRMLSQEDAGTAMIIAETVGNGITLPEDKRWPAIEAWAAELGLSGRQAVAQVTRRPR